MIPKLTKKEDLIVRILLIGKQRKEIACILRMSPNTVSVHLRNIYAKIKSKNCVELYNWYLDNVLRINIRDMIQFGINIETTLTNLH